MRVAPPETYSRLVLFEDEHLLVVNKPSGWNTHAPSPHAGEGLYDWLRHRESRWANLAIIHRLDKETSGVMVFGKTAEANRSLTQQFAGREVHKIYLLETDRAPHSPTWVAESSIVRAGDHYVSRPAASRPADERAETRFELLSGKDGRFLLQAEPRTGRTHQIRVHAAEHGAAILGDHLYGGSPAERLCLHAHSLSFRHPFSGEPMRFEVAANFMAEPAAALRRAVIDPGLTNAFRVAHAASDGWPGCYVDLWADFVLAQSEGELNPRLVEFLQRRPGIEGIYHKHLEAQVRRTKPEFASPRHVWGGVAPAQFQVRENGVVFEISFAEGYSVGLFLDQRDNRRRFLANHVAAGFPLFPNGTAGCEVLNTFAYTCGFSVCAALAGARVTSLDLSRKYLDWGRRNFAANGLNSADHDFIFGDTFNWLGRLARKGRRFDAVILDPPTFSQSKESGVFRAEKDYGRLISAALPVIKPGGVLLASTNAAGLSAEDFLRTVEGAIVEAGRRVLARHYVPQPPDFPISRAEPAYLKTIWFRAG